MNARSAFGFTAAHADAHHRPGLRAWIRFARPQFYPLSLVMVVSGAVLAAAHLAHPIAWSSLVAVLVCTIIVEFFAVATNELHDVRSDQINRYAGPFNGGSRVLVENLISPAAVIAARFAAGMLLIFAAGWLWSELPAHRFQFLALGAIALLISWAYSAPPLRLCARGLGEPTVALTHSILVMGAGYLSQGGTLADPRIWITAAPVFLAILPSILIAGLPDLEADAATGKRTHAVLFGRSATALVAAAAATGALIAQFRIHRMGLSDGILHTAFACHAAILVYALVQYAVVRGHRGRHDGLLIASLSYAIWFPATLLLHVGSTLQTNP